MLWSAASPPRQLLRNKKGMHVWPHGRLPCLPMPARKEVRVQCPRLSQHSEIDSPRCPEHNEIGLRKRNSPMCTLSQNGYGERKNTIAIFFLESGLSTWKMLRQRCACKRHTAEVDSCGVKQTKTVWPSGLRRWLKAPFRKGVGSNPTGVTPQLPRRTPPH